MNGTQMTLVQQIITDKIGVNQSYLRYLCSIKND